MDSRAIQFSISASGDRVMLRNVTCRVSYKVLGDYEVRPDFVSVGLGGRSERVVDLSLTQRVRGNEGTMPKTPVVTLPFPDVLSAGPVSKPTISRTQEDIIEYTWVAQILISSDAHILDELIGDGVVTFFGSPSEVVESRLPVRIHDQTGLLLAPARHWYPPTVVGAQCMRRSIVRAKDGVAFAIVSCEPLSPHWEINFDQDGFAKEHVIEAWFRPVRPGAYREQIELKTVLVQRKLES
jgi:hypothetical protein